MTIEITMPRLSDTMEVGTILHWHVDVGDEVSSGDILADIETDKATMELQTFDDGKIVSLVVNEGEQVNVGTTIATLTGDIPAGGEAPLEELVQTSVPENSEVKSSASVTG